MEFLNRSAPIGVFDSGFGGLTVMRALKTFLPKEQIFYFSDTAHLPYGEKSADLIMQYVQESALFLQARGVKLLVLACHTAATVVGSWLAKTLSIPIVDVVQPSIQEVVNSSSGSGVVILGTRATVASGVYQREIGERMPTAPLYSIACPLFVPLIEEGFASHPSTRLVAQEYLSSLKGLSIDSLLLACTHYPLLSRVIQEHLQARVRLIDPSKGCAALVAQLLQERSLLRDGQMSVPDFFYVSGDPKKFIALAPSFLGAPIDPACVQRIAPC